MAVLLLLTELMWDGVHARMAYGQLQNKNLRKMRGSDRSEVYYCYFGHDTVQSGSFKITMHATIFLPVVLCGCRIWSVT